MVATAAHSRYYSDGCRLCMQSRSARNMPKSFHLGEFEQLVLLTLLHAGPWASAPELLDELERRAPRLPTRGAVYRTLDRLEEKGYVIGRNQDGSTVRGGLPRRSFRVAAAGIRALKEARSVLLDLWSGLEGVLD